MTHERAFPREDDPCGDDLGFDAFRYISAEMSPTECEAFEQRLAEDHLAREAVAEMVQLSELASVALTPCGQVSPAGAMHSHWTRPVAWMSAGAAACLALVAALYGIAGAPPSRPLAQNPASPVAAAPAVADSAIDHLALVRRSAELRDSGVNAWQSDAVQPMDDALLAVSDIDHFDAELNVPNWLLAAVAVGSPADADEIQEN